MKPAVAVVMLLAVWPRVAAAQIDVRLPSLSDPTVRANLGPFSVSASLGRGVEVGVNDRRVANPTSTRTGNPPSPAPRTGGTSAPAPSAPRSPSPLPSGGARGNASAILATAERYLGVPYVWGGTTPRGFDCSGYVQYVFRLHNIELPRTSRQQAHVGEWASTAAHALRPGDLMFFATRSAQIDHIAIYAGSNRFIHSSSSGGGVTYDELTTRRGQWFASHHVATRRVVADGRSLVGELDAVLRMLIGYDAPDLAPRF
jgi:peptidoglycan DL-endopeptidase CwlO